MIGLILLLVVGGLVLFLGYKFHKAMNEPSKLDTLSPEDEDYEDFKEYFDEKN